MTEGPKRLSQTETGELGKSLEHVKRSVIPPERLGRLAERLADMGIVVPNMPPTPGAGLPQPGTEPPAAAPPAPTGSVMAKAVVGVVGAGGALIALVMATRAPDQVQAVSARASAAEVDASSDSKPPAVIDARATERARVTPSASAVRMPAANRDHGFDEASGPVPLASPSPPAPMRPSSPQTEKPLIAEKAEGVRQPSSDPASTPPDTAPHHAGPNSVESSNDPRPAPRPAPPPAPPSSEVELLKQARDSISSDPDRALLLTRRHRAEFPFGAYAQERDFIAVSALSRLGRSAEAKSLAENFRRRYPRSAYLPQLARLLGDR
jgi:hypothetical protein